MNSTTTAFDIITWAFTALIDRRSNHTRPLSFHDFQFPASSFLLCTKVRLSGPICSSRVRWRREAPGDWLTCSRPVWHQLHRAYLAHHVGRLHLMTAVHIGWSAASPRQQQNAVQPNQPKQVHGSEDRTEHRDISIRLGGSRVPGVLVSKEVLSGPAEMRDYKLHPQPECVRMSVRVYVCVRES